MELKAVLIFCIDILLQMECKLTGYDFNEHTDILKVKIYPPL